MNNKMMKKAVAMIASLSMVCSMAISASGCFLFEQSSSSSNDSTPAAHICESVCPECGKCLDVECTEDACAEKCEGHEVVRANEYTQEAETVVCNGNKGTGGDDQIWRNVDSNRSGGMYLSRIGEVSQSNPGYYYFKWSITVANACEVDVGINLGCGGDLDVAKGFPAKLNGEDIAFSVVIPSKGWDVYSTEKLGTVNLVAGDNLFYIYIGEGTLCNIDYFTFASDETLTFNATELDPIVEKTYANTYVQEAETVACNGNVATGGDDQIWRQADENRSGGMWLSRINDVSVANPGHYYFKWLITVAEACEVKVSLNAGVSGGINPAVSFPSKLNGADVSFTNSLTATGWDNYTTQKLGIINLTAGENIFYIYIGSGASCNIDYFQFESDTNLTFNATLIDA